jgi:putative SOS response-associated peptidase YedK
MCGRYSVSLPPDEVAGYFQITGRLPNFPPKYNLAPTQDAPVVRLSPETKQRQLDLLRFGLIPHWAKDQLKDKPLINAQSETVHKRFAKAFAEHRCIVVADGFYEWAKEATPKQPYRITLKSGAPIAFAGIWSGKRLPDDTILRGVELPETHDRAVSGTGRPMTQRPMVRTMRNRALPASMRS